MDLRYSRSCKSKLDYVLWPCNLNFYRKSQGRDLGIFDSRKQMRADNPNLSRIRDDMRVDYRWKSEGKNRLLDCY